jgi:hypothetical protein
VKSLLNPFRPTRSSNSYGTVAALDQVRHERAAAVESAVTFRSSCERAIRSFQEQGKPQAGSSFESPTKARKVPQPLDLAPLLSPMSKMQQEVLQTCSPKHARPLADERPKTSRRVANPSPSQFSDYVR